jgi:hypothetical protein
MTPMGKPILHVAFAIVGECHWPAQSKGMYMERSVRLRLVFAAPVLSALYFYLLIFLIGWTSTSVWPSWWVGIFPSRHIAALTWIVGLHTIGVFSAALPIAVVAVLIAREQAALLGAIVGIIATAFAVVSSLRPDIWQLIWNNHPIYFVTDQIKLLVAVPISAWIIRKLLAHSRLSTTAFR